MVAFTAGSKVRASDINAALPIFGLVTADQTKISSTLLSDITGLAFAVAANSTYVFDAFVAYDSDATADLTMSSSVPGGSSGSWAMYGLGTATTGSIGVLDGRRVLMGTGMSVGGSAAFSSALVCTPRGVITTTGTAGTVQFRFAQLASTATNTIIKAGSWVRAVKVA